MSEPNLDGLGTVVGAPAASPVVELEPGARFAERYTITRRLGGEGMGVVYLASDTLTCEDVALKIIRPSEAAKIAPERLISEGVLARKVSHPHVVRVHDVGEADGQIYLSMEVVEGKSLRAWKRDLMMANEDVSLEAAVAIVRAILDGLAAAHRLNLVHRDIKPENVMLSGTPGAPDFRLKILDFGIAGGLNSGALTGTGPVGTPLYMAPEQMTAPDAVGPAADIFSVGRIFYELLVDIPPEGTWNPPSDQRDDIPQSLDAVLRKTQLGPRQRYQSAAEFGAAIDEALAAPAPSPESEAPEPGAPAPRPETETAAQPAEGDEAWRKTLRRMEDFDIAHNPAHKVRQKLGMKPAQRLSEQSTGKVVVVLVACVVIGIVIAMTW